MTFHGVEEHLNYVDGRQIGREMWRHDVDATLHLVLENAARL